MQSSSRTKTASAGVMDRGSSSIRTAWVPLVVTSQGERRTRYDLLLSSRHVLLPEPSVLHFNWLAGGSGSGLFAHHFQCAVVSEIAD